MRKIVLLFLIFSAGVQTAYAQWVMEVTVSGYIVGSCMWSTDSGSFSSSFNSAVGSGSASGSSLVRYSVNLTSGDFSGTISGSGNASCNCIRGDGVKDPACTTFSGSGSGSLLVTHTTAMGEGCVSGSQSFPGSSFNLSISYTIYKLMDAPTVNAASDGCGTATLTSPSSAASYAWQVTDDTHNSSHWNWLSGKNTQSITVSASDLNFTGFTGSIRYLRVTAGECDKRLSGPSNGFTIYLPGPTAADIDWSTLNCFGDDASVRINSVTGLVSNYNYTLKFKDGVGVFGNIYQDAKANSSLPFTINNTVTQQPGTPMKAGDYQLIIENNISTSTLGTCSNQFTHTITQPTEIAPTITPVYFNGFTNKCHGDNSGSLSASVTGGTPGSGYTYSWSNGSTSSSISGLTVANYSVTVKDSKGCTKSASETLTEPTLLSATVAVDNEPSCDDSNDGQLSVAVSTNTGLPPYTYSWTSGSTSIAAPNLLKGNYTVTVTDNNGCQLPVSKTLPGPSPVIVTLNTTSPTCAGLPDGGKVEVHDVQNGTAPFQYLWNTGDNTDKLINVPAGNYSVDVSFVKNGFTCKGTGSATIIDPVPWTATIKPYKQYHGATISCADSTNGRLDAEVKNNLGQVVDGEFYNWGSEGNGVAKKFIDELGEGNYNLSVRYNGTCQATASYSLIAPLPVSVNVSPDTNYHGQIISCHDRHDGAISVAASDGTGLPSDFTYSWNTGSTNTSLTGLGAGVYTVTVHDVNQCKGTGDITIVNPDEVTADIIAFSDYTGFGVSCNGRADGFLTAKAGGGTEVYSYSWTNGKITPDITALAPGDYTITIADNNGCTATAFRKITEPDVLTLAIANKKDPLCFNGRDGSITVLAQGGAPQYQYSKDNTLWQSGVDFNALPIGTYTLNVTDANGCAGSVMQQLIQPDLLQIDFMDIQAAFCDDPRGKATGIVSGGVGDYQYEWRNSDGPQVLSTTKSLANIYAGIYVLSIIDEHSCRAAASVPITSTDGAKTSYTSVDAKCFDSSDGSAIVKITDGEGPFKVRWPDNRNTLEATNLPHGTYNVLITDALLCTVVQTVIVNSPDALQLNVANQIIPTCNSLCDGSMILDAVGGKGSYTYAWNGGSAPQQSNLCAGVYAVVLTDGNGCVLEKDVELKQPDALAVALVTETLPTCNDGCNGLLEVMASGGNGNYNYAWTSGSTTNILKDICPANYVVAVTDEKGCSANVTFTLHNTPKPAFDLGGGVTLCVGQKYTLNTGSQWKSVQWGSSNGISQSTPSIVVSEDGTYWADVISDKGCAARDTFLLQTSRDLLKAEFFMASMANVSDTIVIVDVSWPVPESIEWAFPDAMKKLYDSDGMVLGQYNTEGTYDVSLTAHLGECVDEMQKTITIIQEIDDSAGGRLGYEKFVKTFTLHPNPNNGRFDVSIEFAAESHAIISVWNAIDLKMVGKVMDDGSSTYQKQIDLRPLPAGNYLLRLDHAKGKDFIRFIVE